MARRIAIYLIVIVITLAVILYLRNPGFLEDIWLWVVGLLGVIISYVQTLWKIIKSRLFPDAALPGKKFAPQIARPQISQPSMVQAAPQASNATPTGLKEAPAAENKELAALQKANNDQLAYIATLENRLSAHEQEEEADIFDGTTYTLRRYLDDGDTTLGLLTDEEKFVCYTLEDSARKSEARIPGGTYPVVFHEQITKLTERYRRRSSNEWFEWHLELQHVPGMSDVFILDGKNSRDTDRSILVGNDLDTNERRKSLVNSDTAFENLYKRIAADLKAGVPVRLRIDDEQWIKQKT